MPESDIAISVVIPVYRSSESLPILIPRLVAEFKRMNKKGEIVLVDDASPDNSWAVLKELKNVHGKALKIARLLTNKGQHNALLCGLSLAKGNVIVTMDDDLQNPPEEIPRLLAGIEQGYDLVIGAYDSKKHSPLRNAGGNFIDWIIRRL